MEKEEAEKYQKLQDSLADRQVPFIEIDKGTVGAGIPNMLGIQTVGV